MRQTTNFERLSIDWVCDWEQLKGKWNWYEFNLIQIRIEKEFIHGQAEIEVYLLGLGFRLYWVWNKAKMLKQMKRYGTMLKEGKFTEWK